MKKLFAIGTLVVLSIPFQGAVAAGTASWTNWTYDTSGSFVQNSNTINVTYTGQTNWTDYNSYMWDAVPTSFTTAQVTNTPGTNGAIVITGGSSTQVNTFHFSQAVINPLMDIFSVGRWDVPVTFNFLNDPTFSILAQGAGNWGGGQLTQGGSSVTGWEGNGLIQFTGTYTDISFTLPNYEYYYGATVGGLTTVSNPVPEPETYAMMLAGLGLLGFMARRRKQEKTAA